MPLGRPERVLLRRLDGIGFLLFAGAIGWTYLTSGTTGAAHRTAGVVAASGAAVLVGRAIGRLAGWLVPGTIAVVAAVLWAADPSDITSHAPLSGPFGYANAKGAFFMIAAGSVLAAIATSGRPVAVAVGLVAAVPFITVPFASQTRAPALLVVTLPILALVLNAMAGPRTAVEICGVLVAAALLSTAALGANYRPGDRGRVVDRLVDASVTERRLALWNEAGTMLANEPLGGAGAGRFGSLSPTARRDRDARWAHNAFLQQGAEAGIVGLGFMVVLFAWAFARLAAGAEDIRPVLAAAVLAAVGIHATLDYVMHFPAIPVATAALVGSGSAIRLKRARDLGVEPAT